MCSSSSSSSSRGVQGKQAHQAAPLQTPLNPQFDKQTENQFSLSNSRVQHLRLSSEPIPFLPRACACAASCGVSVPKLGPSLTHDVALRMWPFAGGPSHVALHIGPAFQTLLTQNPLSLLPQGLLSFCNTVTASCPCPTGPKHAALRQTSRFKRCSALPTPAAE